MSFSGNCYWFVLQVPIGWDFLGSTEETTYLVTAGHGVSGIWNDFVLRVATTKMRELPLDFPEQKETYARICAKFTYLHKTPWGCFYNLDETNVHYVSFKNKTRARKRANSIRQRGKGSDKAQITVTLGACSK
jgi:hypothetical protein